MCSNDDEFTRGKHETLSVPLKFLYDVNKILGKLLFVAQPMALAQRAEALDKINHLEDVMHDLFPSLAIEIDLLDRTHTN
jgi:hypothetical protein